MINKQRLIATTQSVLKFNSENPPGREGPLGQWLVQKLRQLGLSVKTVSYAKDRPNVIATYRGAWPRAKAQREALLLTPHFDTVPVGQGWTKDPFGRHIVNGKIYGRGASDDKGNLACALEVLESLVEDGVRLNRDIVMAATVDEETGSHCGIVPLLDKGVLRPKAALILDSDEYHAIIAQKGLIHCRLLIQGKKAHGAYNWRGVNAIEQAAEIIRRLKRHKFEYRRHSLLRPPTMNVGTIQGGDKVNMVADACELTLDIRFLPSMDAKVVLREVKAEIAAVTRKFKLVIDDLQQPYEIERKHPFVTAYLRAAQALGVQAELKGSEGATVMTFFKRHKIPAFATGFGASGTAHTTDEYARVGTLYRGARILERFLKDYDFS